MLKLKIKNQTSGTLKSQVSDHKKQEEINYLITSLDTELHLIKFFTNS